MEHEYVKTVMNNQQLRNNLVEKLKQIIETPFRIKFLPNDNSFTDVKVSILLPTNQITKQLLLAAITDLWLKYQTVKFQFEKQYRWPPGSDDPSKFV